MIHEEFQKLGIVIKNNRRQQKVECPNCVKIGKTNYKDTCLSIDLSEGLYNCHKCGFSGKVFKNVFRPMEVVKVFKKPLKTNLTKLSDKGLAYLESRGINQKVINDYKLASSNNGNAIVFPYFRNGELINYKTRFIDEKKFFQAQDAEPILYNLDRLKGFDEVIYCEGEFECLSFEVAGYQNVTSVNQGAPNANDKNVDKKLECLTNSIDLLENVKTHILAFDNDPNGKRLEQEFIRRLGAENCKIIDYKDCKDANEYLLKYSAFELSNLVKEAKDVKIDGIFTINDEMSNMLDYYEFGDLASETTYIEEVDKAWKWRSGEVTIWTGYQNEGKSMFLNQLCLLKALHDGDKFAFFTPENMPLRDFFADLICTYIGKPADPRFGKARMTKDEYMLSCATIGNYFYMIYPEYNFDLDTIFEKARYLIKKKGVRHLVIDPYNTIEHKMKSGEREDLYISRFMGKLKRFAIDNDITIQLVAHQLTARIDLNTKKYYKPNLNAIKGGGTFSDKTDNACIVWRPNRAIDFSDKEVVFGSQKIKKQRLVGIPQDVTNIEFDVFSQRYNFNGYSPFVELDKQRNSYFENNKEVKEIPKISPLDAFEISEHEDDVPF